MRPSSNVMVDTVQTDKTLFRTWFCFTLLYLILDYGRPQHVLPISELRLPMVTALVLIFLLVSHWRFAYLQYGQVKVMAFFILLLASHVPFATNNYLAFKAFKTILLYMPFVLSVIVCVHSIERLKKIMMVCVCLEIYIALYAVTHAGFGPGNYFFDENDLCLYINMWLPFCYCLYFVAENNFQKIMYATGVVVGLMAVVISFSRGGFVGLLAMAGTLWLFSRKKVLLLLIMMMLLGLAVLVTDNNYLGEMQTITDTSEPTAKFRLLAWKSAWDMFIDNPLGVGGYNFPIMFPEYQPDVFIRSMWGRVAHSLWFTLISELGIIGTCLYFLSMKYNIKDLFSLTNLGLDKNDEDMAFLRAFGVASMASLMGFFVTATFLSVLYYAHYWYLTGLIVAAVNIRKQSEASPLQHG